MYNPTASSLTRQRWAYQQRLTDEMGMGALDPRGWLPNPKGWFALTPDDRTYLTTCGSGFALAALGGYLIGRVGFIPTVIGVGTTALIYRKLKKKPGG